MFRKLSISLSMSIASVLILALAVMGAFVAHREVQVVRELVLRSASGQAIAGAAGYGRIIDDAIDSGALTLEDVTAPKLVEIKSDSFDKRYRSNLSDYTDSHGIQQFQDAILESCDGCLFASGMRVGGYVPTTNSKQDLPLLQEKKPDGTPIPDAIARNRQVARGKRIYDRSEQIAAAGFRGGAKAPVLIQTYERDTGELAWDVAAPIFVHGQHFGAFRIGVSQDRVTDQWIDLLWRLSMSFGFVAIVTASLAFFMLRRRLRPLTDLSQSADRISRSETPENMMSVPVNTTDSSNEIRDMGRSINRMRYALCAAVLRADAPKEHRPRSRHDTETPDIVSGSIG